jgi:SAM-dependent methyltransferase
MTVSSTHAVEGVRLRTLSGSLLDLPVSRWFAAADEIERDVLASAEGPVLDVGCGPGRHLAALHDRKVFALGIDISPPLLEAARARGVNVLERSVFGRVPGAGRWATALLFDGNIGIGGDPTALLMRLCSLLRPGGRIIAELAMHDDGSDVVVHVRAESDTTVGPWFRWTTVGPCRLEALVLTLGMEMATSWVAGDRRFAEIVVGNECAKAALRW